MHSYNLARMSLVSISWHTLSLSSKTVNSVVWALLRQNHYSIKLQRHWQSFLLLPVKVQWLPHRHCSGQSAADSKPTLHNMHSLTPYWQPLGLFPLMWNPSQPGSWTMLTQSFNHCIRYNSSKGKWHGATVPWDHRLLMIVIYVFKSTSVCKMIFHTLFYVNLSNNPSGVYRQEKQRWNKKSSNYLPKFTFGGRAGIWAKLSLLKSSASGLYCVKTVA